MLRCAVRKLSWGFVTGVVNLLKSIANSGSNLSFNSLVIKLTVTHSFWGVFWISASSLKRASQTFARLAKEYGAREPNEAAAKDWLSNLEVAWLLIIDDAAADDEQFRLDSLFPKGERGHILITTRDETHRIHGTVGSKSFTFSNLDQEPATQLLLKAADKPTPWDSPTQEMASIITKLL